MLGGLLLTAAVIGAVLLFSHRDHGELEEGSMALSLPVTAVVIRDERSISAEKYDRASYLVNEGDRVVADTPVAAVYKWGYSDEMPQSLASLRTQIYEAQMQILEGIEYPELTVLDLSITQKEQAIRENAQQGGADLLVLQKELTALLAERMAYLRTTVQPNEALTALYASEEEKLAQIAAYETEVLSTGEGVVSFYFDGYEEVLNDQKLETVNVELVNAAIKGGAGATTEADETRLYRLINDAHWYIAFATPLSDPLRTVAGMRYMVAFTGYEGNLYVGTALAPVVNDTGILNILEFTTPIEALISVRAVKATLGLDAEGLRLPREAVSIKDGMAGITIHQGGESRWVEVDVLSADEETAIIRSHGSEQLYAGLRFDM